MNMIDAFIVRYEREFDFYDQAARLVAQQLDQQTQTSGIRAIVTSRAKSPARLKKKLEQRASTKQYVTDNDIYDDIVDFAGVRVALYFPSELQEIDKIINTQFILLESPKKFPASSNPARDYKKRFSGYLATHYRVNLHEKLLTETQKRYVGARVEIQVASVLMHAWAEVEHDLVYKPLQGQLSEDEYAILDELNGLVLAGEIALERLQRAAEVRIRKHGTPFFNHYDLAAFLFELTREILESPANASALGRVDVLFELLQKFSLATPEGLAPYVKSLHADTERRPLAEQVIDQILAADRSRYEAYAEIQSDTEKVQPSSEFRIDEASKTTQSIGEFIFQWTIFERFLRELAQILQPNKYEIGLSTSRLLAELQVFDEKVLFEIHSLRRLRNNIVHHIEGRLDPKYIKEATQRIRKLLESFKQSSDDAIRTAVERVLERNEESFYS